MKKSINNEPKINDFVICTESNSINDEIFRQHLDFINNNIGQIVNIRRTISTVIFYEVKYDNIPEIIERYYFSSLTQHNTPGARDFLSGEISYHSENKKELDVILQTNKYNI